MSEQRKRFYLKRADLIAMVERLQRSEPGSVDEIISTFEKKIYGHIMRRVDNKDEKAAKVILENVYSEIFASINALKKPEAFVSWCNRITENQIAAYYRKERKRIKAEKEYYEKQVATINDDNHDRIAIMEHMKRLSPKHAEVTLLHVVQGVPVKEIAARLNIPEGTVKSRLYYGRKQLDALRQNNTPQK